MKTSKLFVIAAFTALFLIPATPMAAAEQCSTGSVACATANGSGYYAPYSCASGDPVTGRRNCVITWYASGSGRGSGIGVVNVELSTSFPSSYSSRQCPFTGGSCAVSQFSNPVAYNGITCNAQTYYATVKTTTTVNLLVSATESKGLSVTIPACTA